MNNAKEPVAYYLQQLRDGRHDDAFFGLIKGGREAVPFLIEAFAREENRNIRAQIVECIWQNRLPETIGFLADLLHDPESEVWKQALDGLVAIGGDEAKKALQAARERMPTAWAGKGISAEWIDEALEQLRATSSV